MSKRLNDIVLGATLLAGTTVLGGCQNPGALLAAVGAANAMNADSPEKARAWAAVAEYGRLEANREAAEAGRSDNRVIINNSSNGENDSGIRVLRWGNEGIIYRGEVLNEMPHGTGKMQYNDGSWYEGEYREGRRAGYGVYHHNDGRIVKGAWYGGKREGAFEFTDSKGNKSTWHYLHDKPFGTEEEYKRALEAEKK